MSHYQHHPAPAVVDDEGEAFARAVFCRFLRQATISRDIDDVIEHMHIVNDDSQTFDIRLGGEARVPVSRELILALAAKKKELLALCESTLRTPRSISSGGRGGLSSSLQHRDQGNSNASPANPAATTRAVVYPPPAALAAMAVDSGFVTVPVGRGGNGGGNGSSVGSATDGGVPGAVPPPAAVVVRHEQGEETAAVTAVPVPITFTGEDSSGAGGAADAALKEQGVLAEQRQKPSSSPPPDPNPPPAASRAAASAPAFVPAGAVAGWRQRDPAGPTTLFVRKVDMKVDRDDIISHFSSFGQVLSVSMNPSRGYAFVDLDSHASVLRAVGTAEHTVGRKTLQVEVKKELTTTNNRERRRR